MSQEPSPYRNTYNTAERTKILDDFDYEHTVKDKWQLLSIGLQKKSQFFKIKAFLITVAELKRRYRVVLSSYLRKKQQKEIDDFEDLIDTFDNKEEYALNYNKKRL